FPTRRSADLVTESRPAVFAIGPGALTVFNAGAPGFTEHGLNVGAGSFANGDLVHVVGRKVLAYSGTADERGQQHGEACQPEITQHNHIELLLTHREERPSS